MRRILQILLDLFKNVEKNASQLKKVNMNSKSLKTDKQRPLVSLLPEPDLQSHESLLVFSLEEDQNWDNFELNMPFEVNRLRLIFSDYSPNQLQALIFNKEKSASFYLDNLSIEDTKVLKKISLNLDENDDLKNSLQELWIDQGDQKNNIYQSVYLLNQWPEQKKALLTQKLRQLKNSPNKLVSNLAQKLLFKKAFQNFFLEYKHLDRNNSFTNLEAQSLIQKYILVVLVENFELGSDFDLEYDYKSLIEKNLMFKKEKLKVLERLKAQVHSKNLIGLLHFSGIQYSLPQNATQAAPTTPS